MPGILYLIPCLLDEEGNTFDVLPEQTISQASLLKNFIVENEKSARKFLKKAGVKTPQNELNILVYGKHERLSEKLYLKALLQGENVGLLSEAGCPAVADPGAEIVAWAHKHHIRVKPLVGPSSILLAVMASGFNGQSFTFHGYLPIDKSARSKRIQELEKQSERFNQTQLFIETPFRNNPLFDELLRSCSANTMLSIACDLTHANEFIRTKPIADWKKEKPELHKRPVVFSIYRKKG